MEIPPGGGGGGGPTGPTQEELCSPACEDLLGASAVLNEKISVSVSASNPAQRQKVYRWKVFRVADGVIFPSTYVVSKETSVQSWVATNQWKFDSFTHSDLDIDGFVGLYSTSYTSVVATPSIFGSTTYNDSGKMDMNFTLKITLAGCTMDNNIPISTNQTWNVNE